MTQTNSKNAIMIYPNSEEGIFNIGDYIQSIAARQFWPTINCYVNRERLDEPQGTRVNLIANGWYMHEPEHWPPHPDINPLFVALHINKSAEKELLSPESIEYFKKHEPIGCRDIFTLEQLRKHNIYAYFSGCMTLTLGRTYKREAVDNGKIYFTDLYRTTRGLRFAMKCLCKFLTKWAVIRRIRKLNREAGMDMSLTSAIAFYTDYSTLFTDDLLTSAVYQSQQFKDFLHTDKAKFEYADHLLKEYSKARFVVTSRIHCALPCLAIGVPVLYLYDPQQPANHNCRLNGLLQLFHLITGTTDGLVCDLPHDGKIGRDFTFSNKQDYKPLADALAMRCEEFVKSCNQV